jgi:ribosomal protein S18 acetylase RimI-like enzyme
MAMEQLLAQATPAHTGSSMMDVANAADGPRIREIAARAGVFSQEEIDCVSVLWEEYLTEGSDVCGYNFIVEREADRLLGFACYGPRDLTGGVFDLYWIAVHPDARRAGVGRGLLAAAEHAVRAAGGRMLVAETSGTARYQPTRKFYTAMGYGVEATIRDFYRAGDDLAVFIKRF